MSEGTPLDGLEPTTAPNVAPDCEEIVRDEYDQGTLVRERAGPRCGVWVGHYAKDPTSTALEIQNVWADERRTHVTIPADVVAALEARQ